MAPLHLARKTKLSLILQKSKNPGLKKYRSQNHLSFECC